MKPPLVAVRAASSALVLRGGSTAPAVASLAGTAASLTKNILGIGVLTLASGIAAGTGVGVAVAAITVFTLAAAYSFSLLGATCAATGLGNQCTFKGLWQATLGERSAWLVDATIALFTFTLSSVYLLCLAELLPPLLERLSAPPALRTRRAAIALSGAAVLPLCLLPSLARLSAASSLGIGAVAFTGLFSLWRSVDGSYAPGGRHHASLPPRLRPRFDGDGTWHVSARTAALCANLGVAYCAHFNAPAMYRSLSGATPRRFDVMVGLAFGLVLLLTMAIVLPGYYTFGSNSQPLILNNYLGEGHQQTADGGATAAAAATVASLVCSFPLAFSALRESVLSSLHAAALARRAVAAPSAAFGAVWWAATGVLAAAALGVAMAVDDLGVAVGLIGSILGGAIMYAAPAAMHAAQLLKGGDPSEPASPTARRLLLAADALLLTYGVCGQMLAGSMVTWRWRHSPPRPGEDGGRAVRSRGAADG